MSTVNFNDSTPAAPTNFNNLKWQSDASGNISGYTKGGTWQTYTPTVTASGAMTVSSPSVTCYYQTFGSLLFYQLSGSFTLGGTADINVYFSLPSVAPISPTCAATALLSMAGGRFVCGVAEADPAGARFYVNVQGPTNWTLGSTLVKLTGFYRWV